MARFREAVNKTIEQRRQLLDKFRDAVKQSMSVHKKKKYSPSRRPVRHSLVKRRSSLFEATAQLAGGAMATQSVYIPEIDDLNDRIAEGDEEVREFVAMSLLCLAPI